MTNLEIESKNGTWFLGRDPSDLVVNFATTTVGSLLSAFHAHVQHKGKPEDYEIYRAANPASALDVNATLTGAGITDGDKLVVVVKQTGGGQ